MQPDEHPVDPAPQATHGRGATVLTLGILSLVLSGCAPLGLILGFLAHTKAKDDLPRIDTGAIDPEERPLTKAGQVCGVVGMCLSGLILLFWIFQFVIFIVAIVFSAGQTP